MNAITRAEANALPALQMDEGELIQVLQNSLYPGAALGSIKMVVSYCKASALDPMQKPVHIVPMWDSKAKQMRDVIMPGIGLYRTQAARNGCAGVTEPEFGPDLTEDIGGVQITFPAWCKVSVKRVISTGQVVEFTAKEFWKENYATAGRDSLAPNAMWKKRPYGQLAKCAEAQALRKAFPEIGSEPTADEMAGKTLNEFSETVDAATGELTKPAATTQARPVWPEDSFSAQLGRWGKAVASGLKSVDDIEAMAKAKGDLTSEQIARIKALKTANAEDAPTTEEA